MPAIWAGTRGCVPSWLQGIAIGAVIKTLGCLACHMNVLPRFCISLPPIPLPRNVPSTWENPQHLYPIYS